MAAKQAEGYVFVDVRPAEDYAIFHAPGSVNVPLFGPIALDSPAKLMKQLLYSFNGMKGTDENPRFLEELAAAAPSKSKVLIMCDSGGTYNPVGVVLEGRRSRSLVAIYKMLDAGGWSDILHVYGGVREWCVALTAALCPLRATPTADGTPVAPAAPCRAEKGMPIEGNDVDSWRSFTGKMPPMPPMQE